MDYPELDKLNSSNCTKRSIEIHYPEFYNYIIKNYNCEKWTEKLYWFYHKLTDYPKCKLCGKNTAFINLKSGYREFCGYRCMNSCSDIQKRKIETSIKNWGTDNPMKSSIVKDKLKDSINEKYGVDNVFKTQEFIQKRKETNIIKYGVEHHMQNDYIKDKVKETNITKYGVECISQLDDYKKIIKDTCIQKYGGIGNASSELKNKYLATVRGNNINNYDFLIGYTEDGDWICKCPHLDCDSCQEKSYIISDINYYARNRLGVEKCTKLYPINDPKNKDTSIELFIQNILNENSISYTTNERSIISPKELDIYIPSKNLAIECNGIYTHSTTRKDKNYHIDKTNLCKDKNIRLLHIWQDWIKTKPDIVESIILNKLGLIDNTIYARKCIIKEISSKICNKFLNENHIQGASNASIHLGLYYNNDLVSVMTFSKPRVNMGAKNHKQQWELVRFCSKIDTRVIGGASKLFKHFVDKYNPESIVSFSMNDISNGNLYKLLKFTNDGSNNSYWYINSKTLKRYHRTSFTKQAIVKKGWVDKVDSSWTEKQVMKEHGYFCIYDSGQTKWVWSKNNL